MPFCIIAHRGFSSQAPENTLVAFDAAVQAGFRNIETDVQLSKDGVVVVVHDEKLGRTNNGVGMVATTDWQRLQALDTGSWFDARFSDCFIPALREVLQCYAQQARLHIELKSAQSALPAAVAAVLREEGCVPQHGRTDDHYSVPGITITSFHLEQLKASVELLPSLPHAWLVQELTEEVLHDARNTGMHGVCPRANVLQAVQVAAAHSQGLVVRAWGIRDAQLLMHVVECGVSGATVNWPDVAAQTLQQAQ